MSSVKESWKQVGSDFGDLGKDIGNSKIGKDIGKLGKDFGKSFVKTVKTGIKAATDWAGREDAPDAEAEEIPIEDATSEGVPAEEGEVIDRQN